MRMCRTNSIRLRKMIKMTYTEYETVRKGVKSMLFQVASIGWTLGFLVGFAIARFLT